MKLLPPIPRRVNRRRRRSDIHEGEPAGIAMCQDAHAFFDQTGAVNSNCPAMLHVFIRKILRSAQRNRLLLRDCLPADQQRANGVHRIHRINRRRPRLSQRPINPFHLRFELIQILPAKRPESLRETIRRRGPDRPGPANHHIRDRARRFFEIPASKQLELVWKQPLLDQNNFILEATVARSKQLHFALHQTKLFGTLCAWNQYEPAWRYLLTLEMK
jgi:hypothetical protein